MGRIAGVTGAPMTGKVAVVTGGSQGVGRAIARAFLERGASVVTCSRHEFDEAPAAAGLDAGTVARARHLRCDHRDPEQVDAVVATTVELHGRLDVLVNNAGGAPVAETATASPRFHAAILETNLLGPLLFARRVYPEMARQDGGGSIVNISSVDSVRPSPGLAAYGAAKAGLNHLTRTLAAEWGPHVRVNCIALGAIGTDAFQQVLTANEEARRRFVEAIPLGRIGRPEEVASLCLFLCGDEARYVNGATIWADGGGAPPSLAFAR